MDLREMQEAFKAEQRKVTVERLEVGALILTVLSGEDGLVFKDGRTEKPKRLIIIGVDKDNEVCYGSVLVNTDMNPRANYSEEYLTAQYMQKQENYPEFLRYDSYADCGVLFAIPIEKLLNGEYYGKLTDDDKINLFDILETTETLSTKQKKRFSIKRR